jgi:hypothetical protein
MSAQSVTLTQLRLRCRLLADLRSGGSASFIADSADELDALINWHLNDLLERMVRGIGEAGEGAFAAVTITTVAGTSTYTPSFPAAAPFFRAVSLAIVWPSGFVEFVPRIEILEVEAASRLTTWAEGAPKAYHINTAGQVVLDPTPNASGISLAFNYAPGSVNLVNGADAIGVVNGFDYLACINVAIELRTMQQKDTSQLERLQEKAVERVERALKTSVNLQPKRIVDVTRINARRPNARGGWWFPPP